jgi:hypothetical protein
MKTNAARKVAISSHKRRGWFMLGFGKTILQAFSLQKTRLSNNGRRASLARAFYPVGWRGI